MRFESTGYSSNTNGFFLLTFPLIKYENGSSIFIYVNQATSDCLPYGLRNSKNPVQQVTTSNSNYAKMNRLALFSTKVNIDRFTFQFFSHLNNQHVNADEFVSLILESDKWFGSDWFKMHVQMDWSRESSHR